MKIKLGQIRNLTLTLQITKKNLKSLKIWITLESSITNKKGLNKKSKCNKKKKNSY